MAVRWSKESSSYMFECPLGGHEEHDFEGAAEAYEAFLWHDCPRPAEVPC